MKSFTVIIGVIGMAASAIAFLPSHSGPPSPAGNCGADLQESIYNDLFVNQHYNKNFAPTKGDGVPVEVTVNLAFSDYVFNDALQQLEVNIFLRQTYNDYRLQYQSPVSRCPRFEYLILSTEESIKSVWTPDTFLDEQLSSFKHEIPDRYSQFIRVYPSGQVMLSQYFSLTVECYKNDKGNPLCKVIPELYASITSEVVLKFDKANPVSIDDNKVNGNRFKLAIASIEETQFSDATGTFSKLIASLEILGGSGGWPQSTQPGWSG